jgi:hypothetical protein
MTTRLLSLLLVLVLSWAGFPIQAHAGAVAAAPNEAAAAVAEMDVQAAGEVVDVGPSTGDSGAPTQAELLIDLPVVFHHGAEAPLPPATMAPPGVPADAAWRSACLDGLQRPPCAAPLAA